MMQTHDPYALLASVERSRRHGADRGILSAVHQGLPAKALQPLFDYRAELRLENEFEFHSYCVTEGRSPIEREDWQPIISEVRPSYWLDSVNPADEDSRTVHFTIAQIERWRERRADLAILKAAREQWPEEATEVLVAYRQRLEWYLSATEAEITAFPKTTADPFDDPFPEPGPLPN